MVIQQTHKPSKLVCSLHLDQLGLTGTGWANWTRLWTGSQPSVVTDKRANGCRHANKCDGLAPTSVKIWGPAVCYGPPQNFDPANQQKSRFFVYFFGIFGQNRDFRGHRPERIFSHRSRAPETQIWQISSNFFVFFHIFNEKGPLKNDEKLTFSFISLKHRPGTFSRS